MDDKTLEVIGFRSSLHMGQIQTGLALPARLGQGDHVLIRTRGPLPIQIDGEPWGIHAQSEIVVTLRTQSMMLTPAKSGSEVTHHEVTRAVLDVLFWAEREKVINSRQRLVIAREYAKRHSEIVPASGFYKS